MVAEVASSSLGIQQMVAVDNYDVLAIMNNMISLDVNVAGTGLEVFCCVGQYVPAALT